MSLRRLNFIFLLIILASLAGVFCYHRWSRPKIIPPTPRPETTLTIIPGWNLRQVADDWTAKKIIKKPEELFSVFGSTVAGSAGQISFTEKDFPLLAKKSAAASFEGFIFPDTYRVFSDWSPAEILAEKILPNLENKITAEDRATAEKRGGFYRVLIMASIIEKEAPTAEDMAVVSDIFWRRFDNDWPLQSCATVNYVTGKDTPAISAEDKEIDSPYNTYKRRGLPPTPICNPGLAAIRAALYPQKNNYWFFMTGSDGVTRYAKTLEEHNANVHKYLK